LHGGTTPGGSHLFYLKRGQDHKKKTYYSASGGWVQTGNATETNGKGQKKKKSSQPDPSLRMWGSGKTEARGATNGGPKKEAKKKPTNGVFGIVGGPKQERGGGNKSR